MINHRAHGVHGEKNIKNLCGLCLHCAAGTRVFSVVKFMPILHD